MEYRREERLYGPDIRFNDWRLEEGHSERAGGAAVFSGGRFAALRDDYPYGGGGDVELNLRFEAEGSGRLEIHFNSGCPATHQTKCSTTTGSAASRRTYHNGGCGKPYSRLRDSLNDVAREAEKRGFLLELDDSECRCSYRGRTIGAHPHRGLGAGVVHDVTIVTLDERYAVWYGTSRFAEGRMEPPFVDNEGWVRLSGEEVHMRLLEFSEHAVVHTEPVPGWERRELLYREDFDPATFENRWIVNAQPDTPAPEIVEGRYTFRHMCNAFLRERFEGPLAVDYTARPVPTTEFSAGVTDAIFIWMASDPEGDFLEDLDALTREGIASLGRLLPYPFYWVDFGGTNNVTTRLRKNPYRHLMRQYTDRGRLLERGRTYRVTVVAHGEYIEFHVDGTPMMRIHDPHPLTRGHVGVRAYVADLELAKLEVHRIGS